MEYRLETRNIEDLKEYAKNPRTLSKEQKKLLKRSMEKYGMCQTILVNPDGLIISGHQRVRVLKEMGKRRITVFVPEQPFSEKEIEELNITLNKIGGEWDFDILANCFECDDLFSYGFTAEELNISKEIDDIKTGDSEESPGKRKVNITFADAAQLEEALSELKLLLESYSGASYKIK